MQDMNNLKNVFGEADDGFKNNVYRTLADLKNNEERKPMKKMSLRLIVAVTAVFILTTTAFAMTNPWGIFDFLRNQSTGVKVLPDASEIVQTDLPQDGGESELAAFSVREAVYDGENIYIVVAVKPTDPNYLLLDSGTMLSEPASNMGPLFQNEQGTISDYAEKTGKTPVSTGVGLPLSVLEQSSVQLSSFILESDGTGVYMLSAGYENGEAPLTLTLDCVTLSGEEEIQRSDLTVTLQNSGIQSSVASTDTAEYADCGIRVDKVTLTGSPMGIYAEVEFTVIDGAKFSETDSGLWFEFIDENGDRLPDGAASGDSITATDDSETSYIQKCSLQASEYLPSEIILRGYNSWDKNRYETHSFEMK